MRTAATLASVALVAYCVGVCFSDDGPPVPFARDNLVAWCVVPFDSRARGPEERAEMLRRLGFVKFAYDWRAEHLPLFDEELDALANFGVELSALWFPAGLNDEARLMLAGVEKRGLHPQLWITMGGGEVGAPPEEHARLVENARATLAPVVAEAERLGCKVALYNHGGWFGEPENQIDVIRALGAENVGIVYNLHHGHAHLERFEAMLATMLPHLLCLNLNGMDRDGEAKGRKILPLGQGEEDLRLLRAIRASGYAGPIGILGHTMDDAEERLRDNLDGLDWLVPQLDESPPGAAEIPPRPVPRTMPGGEATRRADAWAVESPESRAAMPEGYTIRAAPAEELTAAIESGEGAASGAGGSAGVPDFSRWHRSNGDDGSNRYSPLAGIDRENVGRLAVAWTYRSGERAAGGAANSVQCAPVCVEGVLFAPTAGDAVVAIDGATGEERWRFVPGGRPAHRGMVYWGGEDEKDEKDRKDAKHAEDGKHVKDVEDGKDAEAGVPASSSSIPSLRSSSSLASFPSSSSFTSFPLHPPRLLFHSGDRLWAVSPDDGSPIAEFGEGGSVATGPATVAGVVHGNAFVWTGFAGGVFARDVRTGAPLWEFATIPRAPAFGADTWREPSEGANCWGGMSLDAARGLVFVATGSPKPNFFGGAHEGSNLFANCVLALDARTGERRWHFQELRHDVWDLDLPAPPNLVSIEFAGRRVDAVAQTTKTGNTLLLDRATGRPLFDVPMRRAPASPLPGERTWPYQPAIERPEPFSRQVFSADDATTRSEEARDHVLKLVERARTGWREGFEEGRATVFYGIHGGAEWTGASFDPETGRLYVSANELPWIVTMFPPDGRPTDLPPTRGEEIYKANCALCHGADRIGVGMAPPLQSLARRMDDARVRELVENGKGAMPAAAPMGEDDMRALLDFLFLRDVPAGAIAPPPERPAFASNGYPKLLDHEGYPGVKPPWGTLNCIDLARGELVWRAPLGEYPALAEAGLTGTGAENFGGATATAGGLVFCAGTPDRKIRAFDKATGEELWAGELPFGGYAPPIVYEVGGRQFVAIAATGGGKLGTEAGDAWVAFAAE